LKKRLLIGLFCLLCFKNDAQVPVILRVLSTEQIDTLGCNVVRELARIAYSEIINGDVKLWNTASKEIRILPQSLLAIEQSSDTRFLDQDRVFVYEYWTRSSIGVVSNTTGFLFSNRNKFGEDVEYGYVECSELKSALMSERLNINVNGDVRLSLWTILQQKQFHYNLVQFAGKVIDNSADSRQVMNAFAGQLAFNPETDPKSVIVCKDVEWTLQSIRNPEGAKSKAGNALLKAVEQWLRDQEDLFVSIGGYDVLNRQSRASWSLNRIDVSERWSKSPAGMFSEVVSVQFYINDLALNPLNRDGLHETGIRISEDAFESVLSRHEFAYIIRKINGIEIPRTDSFLYQKALEQADWNKISDYVKEM
jgi:hypothetical protein